MVESDVPGGWLMKFFCLLRRRETREEGKYVVQSRIVSWRGDSGGWKFNAVRYVMVACLFQCPTNLYNILLHYRRYDSVLSIARFIVLRVRYCNMASTRSLYTRR